jgi:predicted nucleic acid-binding protein
MRYSWANLMGERRKRLTPELTKAFLQDLQRMRVDVDAATAATVFETIQGLCRKHGLTSYDAAYLELAMRGKYPLATLDDDVMKAAKAEGVRLL